MASRLAHDLEYYTCRCLGQIAGTNIIMYIHIYIDILSSSRKPSGRFVFDLYVMVSVVDIIQRYFLCFMVSIVCLFVLFMVSVVAGNVVYGFRRWFVLGFPSWQENISYGFSRRILDGFCRRRRIQHFRTYRVIPRFGGF